MFGPIHTNVLDARLDPEGVQQAVIVVRPAILAMDGNVKFVGAFNQVQLIDL